VHVVELDLGAAGDEEHLGQRELAVLERVDRKRREGTVWRDDGHLGDDIGVLGIGRVACDLWIDVAAHGGRRPVDLRRAAGRDRQHQQGCEERSDSDPLQLHMANIHAISPARLPERRETGP
jgi:hypothetical protein